jgi:hypothetical protein
MCYSVQSFLRQCYLHRNVSAADLTMGARSTITVDLAAARCTMAVNLAVGARYAVAAILAVEHGRHGWLQLAYLCASTFCPACGNSFTHGFQTAGTTISMDWVDFYPRVSNRTERTLYRPRSKCVSPCMACQLSVFF